MKTGLSARLVGGLALALMLGLGSAGPALADGMAEPRPERAATRPPDPKPAAIAVQPASPADRPLALAVAAALEKILYLAPFGVTVATDAGQVVLYGAVPTLFTLALADQVAAGVAGVTGVDNRLVVSSLDPSLLAPGTGATTWPACRPGRLCVGS